MTFTGVFPLYKSKICHISISGLFDLLIWICITCCAPHCYNFRQVWTLSTYLFPTYLVFTADTLRHTLTLIFDPLTLKDCTVVAWSNSVPNLGRIRRFGTTFTFVNFCKFVLASSRSGVDQTIPNLEVRGLSQTFPQVSFRCPICCFVSRPHAAPQSPNFGLYDTPVKIRGEMAKFSSQYFQQSPTLPMHVADFPFLKQE